MPEASAAIAFLKLLKEEPTSDWTFLSPATVIETGDRIGIFRSGGDKLLTDTDGNSRIRLEDYAVALVDELQQHTHPRKRFNVAY